MITQETDNVKLTFDQLQAIDTAQKRLAVIESEITNAQKVLKGTKMESDRAVKELAYHEELLADLTAKTEAKNKELIDVKENLNTASEKCDALNKEIKEKEAEQFKKTVELDEREATIAKKEKELSEKGSALGKQEIILNNDKATFNEKVAKLKEVISTF